MNYRHAFHVGNHGDVLKHAVLTQLLLRLTEKPAPLFVLDSHAGGGFYPHGDLPSKLNQPDHEAAAGVSRLMRALSPGAASALDVPALARYIEILRAANAAGGLPGSPWLIAQLLRPQDTLAACELQPNEAQALRGVMRSFSTASVHERDGFTAIPALLPPRTTRRALVLIDPPYEQQDDPKRALVAVRAGLQRLAGAVFAIWYPIKDRRRLQPLYRAAGALGVDVCAVELCVEPPKDRLRLAGSGMLIVNPPWQTVKTLQILLPVLVRALGADPVHSRVVPSLAAANERPAIRRPAQKSTSGSRGKPPARRSRPG